MSKPAEKPAGEKKPEANHAASGGYAKAKGPSAVSGACTSWGCKHDATRFNFCEEHYDHFKFGLIKKTGEQMVSEPTELKMVHHADAEEMDAYERLLGDAMAGDATLFARQDSVEAAWAIVEPILGGATPVHEYEPGTWGPADAVRLTADAGGWHTPPP